MNLNLDELSKPFKMRKCKCGGDYLSAGNISINAPNAKCNKCGEETVLSPKIKLEVRK